MASPQLTVAPAAAKVEAADERDLPGDVQGVQSMRLNVEVRMVVLAQRMETRKGRTQSAAASGAAGV